MKVVFTPSANDFIGNTTLATLSKNPVISDFHKNKSEGTWNNHVELGLWADIMLIAPASANTIAKMNAGIADNMLLTTYLSFRNEVIIAPAMDLDMYEHKSTQRNLSQLKEDGVLVIDSEEGELASGLVGKGRMSEPENILQYLIQYFEN